MNRICQLRKINDMTQEELALMLNVQRSAISKYENNIIPLTDVLITKLSDIFCVSTDYLLCNTDNPMIPYGINTPQEKLRHQIEQLTPEQSQKAIEYIEFLISREGAVSEPLIYGEAVAGEGAVKKTALTKEQDSNILKLKRKLREKKENRR